ncbi:MAG: hypothetical protein JSR26_04740 [Proteobacteria bacterium]|nr:hypothetical protein [Pseudomonadota bacterium]
MKNTASKLASRARWMAIPALAVMLAFSGCKKHEAAAPKVAAPLHAPATLTDDAAWQAYYQDVIARHSDGIGGMVSPYYLSAPGGPDYEGQYSRLQQMVSDTVARGVTPDNMLCFMSPDSTKMADLIVDTFKKTSPGSMNKVVILFVGKAADSDRVKAAVTPSGATYKFVEFN